MNHLQIIDQCRDRLSDGVWSTVIQRLQELIEDGKIFHIVLQAVRATNHGSVLMKERAEALHRQGIPLQITLASLAASVA